MTGSELGNRGLNLHKFRDSSVRRLAHTDSRAYFLSDLVSTENFFTGIKQPQHKNNQCPSFSFKVKNP